MNVDEDQSMSELLCFESFKKISDDEEDYEDDYMEISLSAAHTHVDKPVELPFTLGDKEKYTEYSNDIVQCLFKDEQIQIQPPLMSDQLEIRSGMIRCMQRFASSCKIAISTVHLGVALLDKYMNDYQLSDEDEHQKFIALVALILAAKSIDIDSHVPSIKDILNLVDLSAELDVDVRNSPHIDEEELKKIYGKFVFLYCQIEFMIFECCNFNTSYRPTAVSFLQMFQNKIVTNGDLKDLNNEDKIKSFDELRRRANDKCKQMLNVALYNVEVCNHLLPSKVAAAITAAIRQIIGIKTVWNLELQLCFRSTYEEILPIVQMLLTPKNETTDDTAFEKEKIKSDNIHKEEDSGFVEESMNISEISYV